MFMLRLEYGKAVEYLVTTEQGQSFIISPDCKNNFPFAVGREEVTEKSSECHGCDSYDPQSSSHASLRCMLGVGFKALATTQF